MWATKYGITIYIDLYSTVQGILGWKGGIQMEWGRGMSEATTEDIPYIKRVHQQGQCILFSVVFTLPHPQAITGSVWLLYMYCHLSLLYNHTLN
jgi:hypothetical protein